jgi:uncharacterized protein YdeI (BOF family)
MKTLIIAAAIAGISTVASAQGFGYGTGSNSSNHAVSGYTRNNGTYVPPSHATNPNNTTSDNYGTRGNVNPYTGQTGTRTPR